LQQDDPLYLNNYESFGYWDCWPERNARRFAWEEIHRLADLDENLFAPRNTSELGYLGIFASNNIKSTAKCVRNSPNAWNLSQKLREARLRAIHVPKSIRVTKKVKRSRLVLTRIPDYDNVVCTPPDFDEGTCEFGETPQDYDENMDDYDFPAPDFDTDWLETIPEPEDIEASYFYASGLELTSETYEDNASFNQYNPLAPIAEQQGITWADKLGRIWRYLRLGQAIKVEALEHLLPRIN
jgi:hypothetical protein